MMNVNHMLVDEINQVERKTLSKILIGVSFYLLIAVYERPLISSCPIHHRLVNYSSDTLPLKVSSNAESSSSQMNGAPFSPAHYHHGTCQRQYKPKGMITPLVNKEQQQLNENFKHSAPSSTGSSHSSSGISSSMESPYNHWKYLVPLSVTTATATNTNHVSSPIIEPISLTSS